MHVAEDDVNVKMDKPGAILRQKKDFGSVSGYDKISAEYFSLSAGVDTTPLCQRLNSTRASHEVSYKSSAIICQIMLNKNLPALLLCIE